MEERLLPRQITYRATSMQPADALGHSVALKRTTTKAVTMLARIKYLSRVACFLLASLISSQRFAISRHLPYQLGRSLLTLSNQSRLSTIAHTINLKIIGRVCFAAVCNEHGTVAEA